MKLTWMTIPFLAFTLIFGCESAPEPEAAPPESAEEAAAAEGEAQPEEAAPQEEEAPAKPQRRFVEVKGKVTLDGKPAEVDGEIPASGQIETGKDGYAIITLEPGSIVEVRKKTKIKLGKSERRKNSLELALGAVWSFLADGSSYEVVTSNAVAGVRGTVFYAETRSKKESYICACDGEVHIETNNKKGFSKTIKSKMQHKAFVVKSRGKKRQKAKKAKRQNHTDEEKDALLKTLASLDGGGDNGGDDAVAEEPAKEEGEDQADEEQGEEAE